MLVGGGGGGYWGSLNVLLKEGLGQKKRKNFESFFSDIASTGRRHKTERIFIMEMLCGGQKPFLSGFSNCTVNLLSASEKVETCRSYDLSDASYACMCFVSSE